MYTDLTANERTISSIYIHSAYFIICSWCVSAASMYHSDVMDPATSHNDVTMLTGCDVIVSGSNENLDAAGDGDGIAYHSSGGRTAARDTICSGRTTFNVIDISSPAQDASSANAPAFCDVMTIVDSEPLRCLDDVTSSLATVTGPSLEPTHLSSVAQSTVYTVGDGNHFTDYDVIQQQFLVGTYGGDMKRRHNDRVSAADPLMMPLPSENVEAYFSTDNRPLSIDTCMPHQHRHQHHHRHLVDRRHVYSKQRHHQQLYGDHVSPCPVSYSSMSDAKQQQFYSSMYYSAPHHHHQHQQQQLSLPLNQGLAVAAAGYQHAAAGARLSNGGCTSLQCGLEPVHLTGYTESATTEMAAEVDTCRSTLMSMLCHSPSTTSSSSLPADTQREHACSDAGMTAGVGGSFSALLHASPTAHHVDLGVASTSTQYSDQLDSGTVAADLDVDSSDQRPHAGVQTTHTADDVIGCSLLQPYYNVIYSDHQTSAWSSAGIVTLLNSFSEYRGLSPSYKTL